MVGDGLGSRADLDEAIGVSTDDGDIAGLGGLVVTRNVLLDGELEDVLLRVRRSVGVLANVLGLARVLLDDEGRRHFYD